MKLTDLNRRFIDYCVRKRLGRTRFGIKLIYLIIALLGRFEVHKNTKDFKKRGHYIPKLLLRRFRISEKGPKKGLIWQFDFMTDDLEEESINDVAQLQDFYIFKQKGGGYSDYVEKELFANFIESFGSKVIKIINQSSEDPCLTILEQNILATFISFQITRTPAFYSDIRKYILYLYEHNNLELKDLGSHQKMRDIIVDNKFRVSYEDLLNFKPNYSLRGDKNHLGHISRLVSDYIQEKIFNLNFNFLHVPDRCDDELVISDNPVVVIDFSRFEIQKFFTWWEIGKEKYWVLLPVSPRKALLLTTGTRRGGPVEKDSKDLIEALNFAQYLNSLRYIYGRDEKCIKKHLRKYKKELDRYKTRLGDPETLFK